MTIQGLGRLLKQHLVWFILFPCLAAGAIYYFMRNEPRTYKTRATLYTGFTSGYSLRSAEEGFQTDYSAVSNAFDNILTTLTSTQTLYYVGVNLLSQHLQLRQPAERQLSASSFQRLQQAIPVSLWQSLVRAGDLAYTRQLIDSLAQSQTNNPIRKLLNKADSPYSADYISKSLKAMRKGGSDMLDLEYQAADPAIAQQTLQLAISELNERYTDLKRGETKPVVNYYEDQTRAAKQRLDQAEAKLRAFNVQHNVLNFEDELKTRSITREAIVNEYNGEVMRNRAAKAALDALDQRMAQGGSVLKVNTELTDKQAELTAAEAQLITARTNGQPQAVIDRYQAVINRKSDELKQIAQNYFAADNSAESVPKVKLVDEWLVKVLDYEESGARMAVVKKRLDDYQAETTTFTPLESDQRQLARGMTVAEKEYLTLVQSLNQANTHRQDIALDGSMSILDPPVFPLDAQAPKRWLFMAIGAGVGFVIALLLAALRIWADRRIHTMEQAEQRISNPVAAVFPTVKKFVAKSQSSRAAVSMFQQLSNAINLNLMNSPVHLPIITLFSMKAQQGKTWFAHNLSRLYAESDEQVAYCYPRQLETDQPFEQEGIYFFPYDIHANFMNARELADLLTTDEILIIKQLDKIILELPPLVNNPIPLRLISQSAVSVLLFQMHTTWGRRDKELFGIYAKAAQHPVLVALNQADGNDIDAPTPSDLGQITKKAKRYTESNMNKADES